jgi:hypothetical protein
VTRLFAFAVALRRRRRRLRPAHKHDVNGSNFVPCLPSSCPASSLDRLPPPPHAVEKVTGRRPARLGV